jgi:hypothetical protein
MTKELTLTKAELFEQLLLLEEKQPGSLGEFDKIQTSEAEKVAKEHNEKMAKVLDHLGKELDRIGISEITITRGEKGKTPTMKLAVRKAGSGGGGHKGNGYDPVKVKVALDSGDKTQIKAQGSFNLAQYMIETFGDENVRAKLEELCPWMAENGGGSIKGAVRGARDRMGLPTTLEK